MTKMLFGVLLIVFVAGFGVCSSADSCGDVTTSCLDTQCCLSEWQACIVQSQSDQGTLRPTISHCNAARTCCLQTLQGVDVDDMIAVWFKRSLTHASADCRSDEPFSPFQQVSFSNW